MAYADVTELGMLLRLDAPTAQQTAAMQRALDEAAEEIDWELGYTTETPAPDPPPALVVGVNLNRAVEHWRQSYSQCSTARFRLTPTTKIGRAHV